MPDAQNWCPGIGGGPLVQSADIGNLVNALILVQGMRSTDTQEKEIKNGRLAMVSCPPVLTVLTFVL